MQDGGAFEWDAGWTWVVLNAEVML